MNYLCDVPDDEAADTWKVVPVQKGNSNYTKCGVVRLTSVSFEKGFLYEGQSEKVRCSMGAARSYTLSLTCEWDLPLKRELHAK